MRRKTTNIWLTSFLFSLVMLVETAGAAVPSTMNYQGRLTNFSGQNVTEGTYDLKFTLYDAVTAGTVL